MVDDGTYSGNTTDVRIRSDDYKDYTKTYGIVCSPQLKKKKVYSYTQIDCKLGDDSYSNIMLGFIGNPVSVTARFGEDEKGLYVSYTGYTERFYKVSDATFESEGISVVAIIIIAVIVVIVIFAVAFFFVIKKKADKPLTAV